MVTRKSAAALEDALEATQYNLLRYFERRLPTEDAADALGELMLTAWRRIDALPADAVQARMWLFGIARNIHANAARAEHRRTRLGERLRVSLSAASRTAAPAEYGLEVRDAISRLAPDQAELVRLIHWDGFTIAEASAILDVPASTARTRYQRARAELRETLTAPSNDRGNQ